MMSGGGEMQIDRDWRNNGNGYGGGSSDHNHHHVIDLESFCMRERSRPMSTSSSVSPSSNSGSTNGFGSVGGVNFIEHTVTKMDTLAGVAIKYGVEVADIKRMNNLVSDLQMFALKSLQIPLPGRHPPSPVLSNGSATPGENSIDQNQPRRARSDILETLQSLKFESPQRKVSPAMNSLQGYYRLKPPPKRTEEGTEMAVYSAGRAHYLEDGPYPVPSPLSEPPPSLHRKSRSLANGFENGELAEDVPVTEVGDGEAEKSKKSVRRRQKADTDTNFHASHTPLKEENGGGSGFSPITGKGLANRTKSTNRIAVAADGDSGWLNPVPAGPGESLATSLFDGVRKSSSTSSLQDQESNGSSIWTSSKWSLKPDLQAFSAASLARPIFDGLPKPISGRRSKAALD